MVDVAFQPNGIARTGGARKRSSLRVALKRKSTAAFLMTLPLFLLIGILVIYPALYSVHLATLNKSSVSSVSAISSFCSNAKPFGWW